MNAIELGEIREKLLPYLEEAYQEIGLNMIFFMLTNILTESTELLCEGAGAKQTIIKAFHLDTESEKEDEQVAGLAGVVSRKKQLVPAIMMVVE